MRKPPTAQEIALKDAMDDWRHRLEAACKAREITTREGIVFDEATGEISDALAWELENDD